MVKKPIKTKGWNDESLKRFVLGIKRDIDEMMASGKTFHVHISEGNRKMGTIPSVSCLPILDCPNSAQCRHICYDVTHVCGPHPSVLRSRERNSVIMRTDLDKFFREIHYWISGHEPVPNFRFNVGGDIPNKAYFMKFVELCNLHPGTTFLAFTKSYGIVNDYVDANGPLPDNMKILFSVWPRLPCDNPHNFPTTHILFDDFSTTAHEWAFYCPNNCSECVSEKKGCYNMEAGQEVIFPVH